MPELPEVEVVRRGLARHAVGHVIDEAEVLSERAARRYEPGREALARVLRGRTVIGASRRGKYLWLRLSVPGDDALVIHLGMSGQLLVRRNGDAPARRHLRAALSFGGAGSTGESGRSPFRVEFVDQRTFGWLLPARTVTVDGAEVPAPVSHIARDPLDPAFDAATVARRMRVKHTEIKRLLLDQTVVSGIGNIYADEALWRARIHGTRAADRLTGPAIAGLLGHARDVMTDALSQGGTSFDELYVNVNGESGYFSRSLDVYGRAGEPCSRCGAAIRRETFMNRSSHSCPRCQVRPRRPVRRA